ncbi:uncharacterized protein SETTUDRAFT_153826 [Exserohilum turcica Et28A]|uniref:Rhodopsin domain-containing protein n=1 Tax=Exserohilum turcicum (strain 28A) TaxID=671987 RepID=R0IQT7_EXST2|nr:uncharacterized protein SETTUDRAFT_153826 [Exserohilum turcica Et28A]EOA87066.1 hypothetical protein SETTUDRAFT_153826 [Exserohilum turcica Et28A]
MDNAKRPAFREGRAAPLIQILAWLFLAFSTLSIIAHFATKKFLSRPFIKADFILLAALLLAIGQTVTFLCRAGQAIGNSQADLSGETIMQAWKAFYIGELLSILTIVAAKGVLLIPFTTITPVVKHRINMYTTCVVTVLWGLSAVLLIAFQCPSPQRWDITNSECIDIRAVRTYNATMNIMTDLALATVPTLMVIPLQINSRTRLILLAGFWSRLIVVIASVVQIVFIRTLFTYNDLLYCIWPVVVCGQIVQVTSIMTSTIPFLKPFLLSLESSLALTGKAVHVLSYISIDTQQSYTARADKQNSIWVRTDFQVQGEPSLELPKLGRD